jgi:hypothetical protein
MSARRATIATIELAIRERPESAIGGPLASGALLGEGGQLLDRAVGDVDP